MGRAVNRGSAGSEEGPEPAASAAPSFLQRTSRYEVDGGATGRDRRVLVVVCAVLGLVAVTGAIVAASFLAADPRPGAGAPGQGSAPLPSMAFLPSTATPSTATPSTAPPSAALPSLSPPAVPSPTAVGEVAGSDSVTLDFDLVATGANLGDWTLSGDGALEVAALPTAVQRSARLDARTRSSACLPINRSLGTFTTRFMVDRAPTGEYPLLTVRFEESQAIELTVSDAGASLDGADPVPFEAGVWYGWELSEVPDLTRARLLSPDDEPLAEAEWPGAGESVLEFCVATVAPTRAFLDEVRLEAP